MGFENKSEEQLRKELAKRTELLKAGRKNATIEYWNSLKPFKTSDDIPHLPVVDEEEWKQFFEPILIKCGAIPRDQLKDGQTYEGTCRNSTIARWDAEKKEFFYWRYKFAWFIDSINHFQDYVKTDLFVPIKEIDNSLFEPKKIK